MNQNDPISRRKFLAISSAAAAALLCAACGKLDSANGITEATSLPATVEAVPSSASTPAINQGNIPAATQTPHVTQLSSNAFQCPKRLIDDPYPGRCRHYLDSNGNGYCDYSQK